MFRRATFLRETHREERERFRRAATTGRQLPASCTTELKTLVQALSALLSIHGDVIMYRGPVPRQRSDPLKKMLFPPSRTNLNRHHKPLYESGGGKRRYKLAEYAQLS